jgi:EcoEI R protein C-terminal
MAVGTHFNGKQQAFLDFVLSQYVKVGAEELDQDKLSLLLKLKYNNAIADAVADLGRPEEIGHVFAGFQKYLYQEASALITTPGTFSLLPLYPLTSRAPSSAHPTPLF